MNLASLLETYGDHWILAIGGGLIGLLFGFTAQRSKFCARAAVIEGSDGVWGPRFAGWLLAFASAILMVQAFTATGFLKTEGARHLGAQGSISGAILGGLMFGIGMIMTRGCASRLIILSANGNLRAWISGLVFAVTVQASISGSLAPLRKQMAGWWLVDGGPDRNLLILTSSSAWMGWLVGFVFLQREKRKLDERERRLEERIERVERGVEEVRYDIPPAQRINIEGSIIAVLCGGVEAGVAFFASSSNPLIGVPREISQFFRFFPLKRGFWEYPALDRKKRAKTMIRFFMIVGFD